MEEKKPDRQISTYAAKWLAERGLTVEDLIGAWTRGGLMLEATEKLVREHAEQFGGEFPQVLHALVRESRDAALDPPRRKREALLKPGVRVPQEQPRHRETCDGDEAPGPHHKRGCENWREAP